MLNAIELYFNVWLVSLESILVKSWFLAWGLECLGQHGFPLIFGGLQPTYLVLLRTLS